MADRSSFGDNAATAASAQPRALHQDSNDLATAMNLWKEKQVQNLQSLRDKVNQVTHGNGVETAAVGALAFTAVAADVFTHGALHRAAKDLAPEALESLGLATKSGVIARTGGAIDRIAARDASAAESLFSTKAKSVSIGDLKGWQEAELQAKIRGDKTFRGLTADFREAKGAHTHATAELAIATRDQTQLATELKGLKQLRSETVDSPLTAESSPALKKIKAAQQNAIAAATDGTPEERAAARRAVDAAKNGFEKAKAEAPTRIEQIEGTAGKPGLLTRVNDHIAQLQTKTATHTDTIADIAKRAQAHMDGLKESRVFETPTSAEDQAFRKREAAANAPRSPQSILTAEERTGIAAPPPKPVVEQPKAPPKVAEPPSPKVVESFTARTQPTPIKAEFKPQNVVTPPREAAFRTPPAPETVPREVAPAAKATSPAEIVRTEAPVKVAEKETPKADVAAKATTAERELSGYKEIDTAYSAALQKTEAFRNHNATMRHTLTALKDYTDSVSKTMAQEVDPAKRQKVFSTAVRDLEQLLQPVSAGSHVAPSEMLRPMAAEKRFSSMSHTIENRLAGIERKIAEREVTGEPFVGQITPKTREAIDAFAAVQSEIPKDAKIYAVRTDGKIVDVTLPSSRVPGQTRTVPRRIEAAQIADLGAESVLARNFGHNNDIGYFVVVETKRDAEGAAVITNAADIALAEQYGRKAVSPIPDQVVSRVIGDVPEDAIKPGGSFREFYAGFNRQIGKL